MSDLKHMFTSRKSVWYCKERKNAIRSSWKFSLTSNVNWAAGNWVNLLVSNIKEYSVCFFVNQDHVSDLFPGSTWRVRQQHSYWNKNFLRGFFWESLKPFSAQLFSSSKWLYWTNKASSHSILSLVVNSISTIFKFHQIIAFTGSKIPLHFISLLFMLFLEFLYVLCTLKAVK